METPLFTKQRQEWEEFQTQYDASLNQLMSDEMLIRSQFGFRDDKLSKQWKDKLERERKAWTEEWSLSGRRTTELRERHQQEQKQAINTGQEGRPTEEEMNKMYEAYHNHSERGDVMDQLQIKEYQQTEKRKRLFNELSEEVNAVRNHYEKSGKTMPAATHRRLTKQVVAFREEWDGYQHDIPSTEMQTLDETDLKREFKAWNDLREQHAIIENHYDRPEVIPKETRERMATEEREYWQEVSTQRKQEEQQSKQSEFDTAEFQMIGHREQDKRKAEAFKERLKEMRERQQSQHTKPRFS